MMRTLSSLIFFFLAMIIGAGVVVLGTVFQTPTAEQAAKNRPAINELAQVTQRDDHAKRETTQSQGPNQASGSEVPAVPSVPSLPAPKVNLPVAAKEEPQVATTPHGESPPAVRTVPSTPEPQDKLPQQPVSKAPSPPVGNSNAPPTSTTKPVPILESPENEEERKLDRAERLANNPRLAQAIKLAESNDKVMDACQDAIAAFIADPSADTALALDKQIAILRQRENLLFFDDYVPLGRAYANLTDLDKQDPECWQKRLSLFDSWREWSPKSSAPLIAKANLLIDYAWDARGSGFASSVTEEGGRKFRERILAASAALEEAASLEELDPEYYHLRINVETAAGGDPKVIADAVKQSAALAPQYFPTYRAAAWFLLPRWHGEVGDSEAFANQLLDQLGGEDGAVAFLQVAKFLHRYQPELVRHGKYDPQKVRTAIEVVLTTPQAADVLLFTSEFVWALQDPELARRYFVRNKYYTAKEMDRYPIRLLQYLSDYPDKEAAGDRHLFLPFTQTEIDYSPDGKYLAASLTGGKRGAVAIISTESQSLLGLIPEEGTSSWCRFVRQRENSLVYNVKDEKTTHFVLRNLSSPNEMVTFDNVEGTNFNYAISGDGSRLAARNMHNQKLTVWDGKSGVIKHEKVIEGGELSICFSPDNKIILVGYNRLKLYDPESDSVEDMFKSLPQRKWIMNGIAGIHDDGGILFLSTRSKVHHWRKIDSKSLELKEYELNADFPSLRKPCMSLDGRFVADWLPVEEQTFALSVIDTLKGTEVSRRNLMSRSNFPIAISPDNKTIAVSDHHRVIRFYDLKPSP